MLEILLPELGKKYGFSTEVTVVENKYLQGHRITREDA